MQTKQLTMKKTKNTKGKRRKRRRELPEYVLHWPYVVALVMIRGYSFVPVKCRKEVVRNSGAVKSGAP